MNCITLNLKKKSKKSKIISLRLCTRSMGDRESNSSPFSDNDHDNNHSILIIWYLSASNTSTNWKSSRVFENRSNCVLLYAYEYITM